MEVLGEAVKRLPSEFLQAHPSVPWKLMARMRDRVSHEYDGIDYTILWDTVHQDLPSLLEKIDAILKELDRSVPS